MLIIIPKDEGDIWLSARALEMPYVTIRIPKELATPEVKAKFIARISEAIADVIVEDCGANREKVLAQTMCIVEEIPFENWGVSGIPRTLEKLKESIDARKTLM